MSLAPPPDEVHALVGDTLGGYRLVRLLGRGGMGAVYEGVAEDGARVAVKVILEADRRKPELLRRFIREAKTTIAIDSKHVVRVLDVTSDSALGVPYIVMELLRGTDLHRVLRDGGALRPAVVARLFVDLCAGLAAAHARGIIHRDVKPANVFLHCAEGDVVVAKVCDFGIAKDLLGESDLEAASTELTRTGGFLGSPPYMSPEQAKNSKGVDARSDVWSLGVALYEALSGRRPFECDSVVELMVAIITQPISPLSEVAPWIDPTLAAVVHRALERDPTRRHASMDDFAEALRPFAAAFEGSLTLASFVPIDDETRRTVARRSIGSSGSITGAAGDVVAAPRPRWHMTLLAAGMVLLGAMVGLSVYVSRKGGEPNAGTAATTNAPTKATTSISSPISPISTTSTTSTTSFVGTAATTPPAATSTAKPPNAPKSSAISVDAGAAPTSSPATKTPASPSSSATWNGPTGVSSF